MTPLFRRKKDCYYGEAFVVSNEKVDNHIHKVYQGVKQRVRALLHVSFCLYKSQRSQLTLYVTRFPITQK